MESDNTTATSSKFGMTRSVPQDTYHYDRKKITELISTYEKLEKAETLLRQKEQLKQFETFDELEN